MNELERASRLTRLGEPAEAPIRRALRSVGPYGAEVARVSDAATAGTPDRAASARAGAIMTNLIRANTARVGALQDDATRRDASALRRSRWPSQALALLPLVALLVVLVLAQLLLARRFRRLVNVPLLLATLVVVGVAGRTVQLHQRQTDRLDAAVSGPYTAAQRLTNTRVLAYEVEGRRTAGGGAVGAADDAALTATVNDAALAATAHGAALTQALSGYVHPAAVGADASQPGSPASRFNVLDAELLTARSDAQMEFTATIDAARAGQRTTTWLPPVLLAVAAGLAWLGLQRRLAEYR